MIFGKRKNKKQRHTEEDSSNARLWRQVRFLTQLLIVSGTLNIGFISFYVYSVLDEQTKFPSYENMPAADSQQQAPLADFRGNKEVIRQFQSMSFEQLVSKIAIKDLVEDGFTQRDLALACMVDYHHFNLQEVFQGETIQKRVLLFGEEDSDSTESMVIFPGLNDDHYREVVQFIRTERWPLTSHGLFILLQKRAHQDDPTLAQAFFLTSEFSAAEALLARANLSLDKEVVLDIILVGDWRMLADFSQRQKNSLDLSTPRLLSFLLDYIAKGSETAANIILKTDGSFATKKLDDYRVIEILNNLKEKTAEAELFAQELIMSPRSDRVLEKAAERLYTWSGEEVPEVFDHEEVISRYVPEEMMRAKADKVTYKDFGDPQEILSEEEQKPLQEERLLGFSEEEKPLEIITHVVAEGDTLWQISKLYRINIEDIKRANGLETDFIKPGTALKIPRKL